MKIITRQDLINYYGESEVARASGNGGDAIDEVSLSAWLDASNAKVASYLLPNGITDLDALPLSSIVALKNAGRVVCWYWMWKDGHSDDMEKDYKAEIRWLESIMKNPAMIMGNEVTNAAKKLGSIPMVRR